MAGVCSMHIYEKEEWYGFDSPGSQRLWVYYVRPDIKDANGDIIAGSRGTQIYASDKYSARFEGLYATMVMTPESQGGDYIQFTCGDQSWKSLDQHDLGEDHPDQRFIVPGCNVGAFGSHYSPTGRDMDCWFHC
jgi:hypothetical protein